VGAVKLVSVDSYPAHICVYVWGGQAGSGSGSMAVHVGAGKLVSADCNPARVGVGVRADVVRDKGGQFDLTLYACL
jgi:hypothetical protein